jgi:hypothetical protein
MSIPTQRKSAEEIAKLRESHGIQGQTPKPDSAPQDSIQSNDLTEPIHSTNEHGPKPVRSLKRSERSPIASPEPASAHVEENQDTDLIHLPASDTPLRSAKKIVHSLRKSEQGPLSALHEPAPDSTLPLHRHSNKEIEEIRRREILSIQSAKHQPPSNIAHLGIIIPGYVSAIIAAVCYFYYQLPIEYSAACVAISILISAFIGIRKPLSQHHAAFIAIITLFVIIFGLLHYFPQLRHGT